MKFLYKNTWLLDKNLIIREGTKLIPYLKKLSQKSKEGGYHFLESSLNLVSDSSQMEEVKKVAHRVKTKNLKYIVVIGIGGSNLGTKAVYDALYGHFDTLQPNRLPKILFSDTSDGEWLARCSIFLQKEINSPDEVLIVCISKSGSTTESIANFEILFSVLKKKWNTLLQRCVIITDEGSKLALLASQKELHLLFIPKEVGGRYSVFSSVGLFPLSLVGIDCKELLEGARTMREQCLLVNGEKNPALQSALFQFLLNLEKRTISDMFLFAPCLESLGKWYRQLLAESIGKEFDRDGKVVHCGIMPTVSIGSTDLHSMGQLYLAGPRDKMTTFVSVGNDTKSVSVPKKGVFNGLVDSIYGKTSTEIMSAILSGIKRTYQKKKIPFCEIILDDISPKSLGEFMQFKMMEVMFLGELLNVNAFDQPNVEEYKIETKRILKK